MENKSCDNMPPKIDKAKCDGCDECVEVCPANVLEVVNKKSTVVKPKECMDCRACESVCPKHAIKF